MTRVLVGVDSVEISRMERSIQRERFFTRVFSPEEQAYILGKHTPAQTAAGHFAAKEAFLKAMGVGILNMDLWEVGITHDALGAPSFAPTGWAAELLLPGDALSLSITHAGDTATAFAAVTKETT